MKILNRLQTNEFSMEFERYGKIKESEIRPMGDETGKT